MKYQHGGEVGIKFWDQTAMIPDIKLSFSSLCYIFNKIGP